MCRYTDQDFDAEFIHILQQACQKYIDNEGETTLEEVADFIRTKVGPGNLCLRNCWSTSCITRFPCKVVMKLPCWLDRGFLEWS